MKIYIIAGEASGDLHASNLIKAIHQIEPEVSFRCWGGDKMKDTGATIVKHIKELAFMGFIIIPLTNSARDRGWDKVFKFLHNFSVLNTIILFVIAIVQLIRIS